MNEAEAKILLNSYDIPVVSEIVAQDAAETVEAAKQLGFPVVIKGLSRTILHKTERGLVHLNLSSVQSVETAVQSILSEAGSDLDGFTVQPMVAGKREFVAGLFRDQQFGAVIMFGLGGIFTEAFKDVSFRLAPLTPFDAEEMISEINAAVLLDDFRGEKAVDRSQIAKILMGLSQISIERPDISEIDINPLVASPAGQLVAVDALIVENAAKPKINITVPVRPDSIGDLFYPKSIAFIGASSQLGKWGHTVVANTISGGFKGPIYLVNPGTDTIAGHKVFASVQDIPAKVDLAVVTIPAAKVMDLIPQLQAKNIPNMLLISSGFGETGPKGKDLEKSIVGAARDAGILILGPNTMGICNPHINFYCMGSPVKNRPGSITVVAQSGNMGIQLLTFAEQQDIGIRGFCGSGNEAMMTIEDYLDGLEVDDVTRTVMLYIESVKDGRRFFESAFRVGKQKPIVLLKGGRSAAGNQAAASHTGALTTDIEVFNAACRQAGIVKVEQPMELLDLSAAFSSLPLPKGNRTAIMTLGGGWGVITADLCSDFGLEVPSLSTDLISQFDEMLPEFWSRSNPVDLVGERDPSLPMTVIEELLKWDGCDGVINLGILGRRFMVQRFAKSVLKADPTYTEQFMTELNNQIAKFEEDYVEHIVKLMQKYNKPILGVSLLPDKNNKTVYRVKDLPHNAIFYPTPERAVKAFAKMVEYQRFLNR